MHCCPGNYDEQTDENEVKGPRIDRSCTDILCAVGFFVYLAAFCCAGAVVVSRSNTSFLFYGRDYNGQLCGKDAEVKNKPRVFYPNLASDMKVDPTLQKTTGFCVPDCPQSGAEVVDYSDQRHVAALPTFEIAGRCVPYEPTNTRDGPKLCANPACEKPDEGEEPTKPQQVCGLELDNTNKYWLLDKPNWYIKFGWMHEQGIDAEKVEKRSLLTETAETVGPPCEVAVYRSSAIKVDSKEEELMHKLLTRYTGKAFRQGQNVIENWDKIFLLGILGSFILSLIIIATFACIARIMFYILIVVLFVTLCVVDYILWFQADMAAQMSRDYFNKMASSTSVSSMLQGEEMVDMMTANEDANLQQIYQVCAVILFVLILLLACLVMSIKRNFDIMIALVDEASHALREMPSLLLFPFLGVGSIIGFTCLLINMLIGVMTLDNATLQSWGADLADPRSLERVKRTSFWIVFFSFLWIYFFHMAIYTTTIAGAVSHWYFYRHDADNSAGTGIHSKGYFFGRPVIYALGRTFRYHLGSMAFGSLLIAICTMPRIILEYIMYQTKQEQDMSAVMRCVLYCLRCCLWCFEKCIRFLTEYAYIDVAVSGRGFCRAAHATIVLIAKYPVQVALDQVVSSALYGISCLTIPCLMVAAAWWLVSDIDAWISCAVFIAVLAYMITRLAVGVYDVAISTLFVCAMRDAEKYNGKYAGEGLRNAMQLPEPAKEVEMAEPAKGAAV